MAHIDASDINKAHTALWSEWSEGRIHNSRSQRDDLGLDVLETEMFYGYRGLMLSFDAETAKAHLRTKHAQRKVSDVLFEAVMEARGEGNLGIDKAMESVDTGGVINSYGEIIFQRDASVNAGRK